MKKCVLDPLKGISTYIHMACSQRKCRKCDKIFISASVTEQCYECNILYRRECARRCNLRHRLRKSGLTNEEVLESIPIPQSGRPSKLDIFDEDTLYQILADFDSDMTTAHIGRKYDIKYATVACLRKKNHHPMHILFGNDT